MSKILTGTWDDCSTTSERKSQTHTYDDLVDLLIELALERENDSHMEKFLKRHLDRGGTPIFRVNTPQGSFHWFTLPFGWKYSPVLCQRLVSALVRRALRDLRARGVTYLDDVLVSAVGRNRLRVALRRVSRGLGRIPDEP